MAIGTLRRRMLGAWAALENPVLGREFRSRMRGDRAFRVTGGYALVVALLVVVVYWVSIAAERALSPEAITRISRGVWFGGCAAQAWLIPLIVPAFTCGAITLERERDLLELLLLTRLSAGEICRGKLWSGVGLGSMLVLTSLPPLMLSVVLGGIAPLEILASLTVLLAAVLGAGALGLAVSTLVSRTTVASAITYGIVGLGLIGMPVMHVVLDTAHSFRRHGWSEDFALLGWIGACHAVALPPAVVLTGIACWLRRRRPLPRPTWLLAGGLLWNALALTLYTTGLSEWLHSSDAMILLHPVGALTELMSGQSTYRGPGVPTGPHYPYYWMVCSITYAGAALCCYLVAVKRVRQYRM